MKKVIILQKYLMPYRVPLFNAISADPRINLIALYYGIKSERRKATVYPKKTFQEYQSKVFSIKITYEYNIDFPFCLFHDLKKLKPDVIICAPDVGGLAAWAYANLFGARYIIWSEATHVTESTRTRFKIPFRKLLYSYAWRFLVPGQKSEEYIRSFVPDAEIFYANNAIQFEENFRITSPEILKKFSENRLQITFSGSLIKDKGILLLLEAFQRLLKTNPTLLEKYTLKILGTGPLNLQDYYGQHILFTGFLEGKEYIDNMKASHIFILPSLHDCNPLTVIEALFTGNILIVTDAVGNYPEAIKDNGFVIPAGSAEEIFNILQHVCSLPRETLLAMARRSLELAENFTVARSASGFLRAILT